MREKLATLWAYITNQEQVIEFIYDKITDLKPLNEDKMIHLAYQLHNLYAAYEDLFKEISITFENNIERSAGFHKNLLIRMKIDIPKVRPKVLNEHNYQLLTELMGFMHVFRHAYNYNLSLEKMEQLRTKIIAHKIGIDSDITAFKLFLSENFSS
jgi:hypothetical protein